MSTIFKEGDELVYYREPTTLEWQGVGEIPIDLKMGDVVTVSRVGDEPEKSLQVIHGGTTKGWYPKEAFKLKTADSSIVAGGSYIVTTKVTSEPTQCAKQNYCFKQKTTSKGMHPECDLVGSTNNANYTFSFDRKENLLDWRFATPTEIKEYDRIGKPYDVTTIKGVTSKGYTYLFNIGDLVEVIKRGSGCSEMGTRVTITEMGDYVGDPGYKVDPPIGNTLSGNYNGFIGESSFRLVRQFEQKTETKLEEARRRYPIGTKFYPAHMEICKSDPEYCIIVNDTFGIQSNKIWAHTSTGSAYTDPSNSSHGNCDYNRNVFYEGKWAEIIEEATLEDPLITKAKRDYPPGTTYYSVYYGCKYTIGKNPEFKVDDDGDVIDKYTGVIFSKSDNRWGKIKSATEEAKLIAKAKKDYPPGTIVKSLFSSARATIKSTEFKVDSDGDIVNLKDYYNVVVYDLDQEKWAEIINTAEEVLLRRARRDYPIGTKIKSAYTGNTSTIQSTEFIIDSSEDVVNIGRDVNATIYRKCKDVWAEILKPDPKPSKPKDRAVATPTKEMWNFASTILGARGSYSDYESDSALDINHSLYDSVSNCIEVGYEVLTFEEWCKEFGHNYKSSSKPLEIDRKVTVDGETLKEGDWVEIVNLDSIDGETLGGRIGHKGMIVQIEDLGTCWYTLEPYCTGGAWEACNLKKIEDPTRPQVATYPDFPLGAHKLGRVQAVYPHLSHQMLTDALGKVYHSDFAEPMSWEIDTGQSGMVTPTIKQVIIHVKKL